MKKLLAVLLMLALLLPVFSGIAVTGAVEASAKVTVTMNGVGTENLSATLDMNGATGDALVSALKAKMDSAKEGNRYFLLDIKHAFLAVAEDDIFYDKAVEPISKAVDEFLAKYLAAGGKLDGITVDLQIMNDPTCSPGYWWLRARHLLGEGSINGEENANPYIYDDIVENPTYITFIRPMLVECGFIFNLKTSYGKPEIYGIRPYIPEADQFGNASYIWNYVVSELLSKYIIDSVTTPLNKHYPQADVPGTYSIQMEAGTASALVVRPGETVTITVNNSAAPQGSVFDRWVWGTGSTAITFADATSPSTTFVMPEGNVSIRAAFRDVVDDPSGTNYKVVINKGAEGAEGAGSYAVGTTVTVNAGEREGDTFLGWSSENGIIFADPSSKITTFTMPSGNANLLAMWQSTLIDSDEPEVPDGTYEPFYPTEEEPLPAPNMPGQGDAAQPNSGNALILLIVLAVLVVAGVAVVAVLAVRIKKLR